MVLRTVSYARPPKEDEIVKNYLGTEIRALGVSTRLQERFVSFAVEHGRADKRKFRPRLYHVINGRTPSAYIAILLVRFFKERRYEDFVRTAKDHVEYITSDGEIAELERFVAAHPLMLRIVRVRMTDWAGTGKPNSVDVHLRSPIPQLDEAETDKVDTTTGLDGFNQRLFEFHQWVASQARVPGSLQLKTGELLEVRHEPDWLRYADEDGFEWGSDLSGSVDISHAVRLLRYAELGVSSPDVPSGLDTFYELSELFCGSQARPAPADLSFETYWPRIVSREADLAEIFFTHVDRFSPDVRSSLEPFFRSFASRHRDWVEKAMADTKQLDEKDDSYVPRPEDVFHYNRVKEIFFDELKPVFKSCWKSYAQAALSILETERVRFREHFEKMKKMKHLFEE